MIRLSAPLGLAAALAAAATAHAQTARYSVTDLGTVPGSTVCECFFGVALSNEGHVAGRFFNTGGHYAGFLWHDGVMVDVGDLGGGLTLVFGVNDSGVVAGLSMTADDQQVAITYANGVMTPLETLGGDYGDARDINNAGIVVGNAQTRGHGQEDGWQRPAMWTNGVAADLGTFGGEFGAAFGVNSAGHAVGWAWDEQRRIRAFLARPGQPLVDLGNLGVPVARAADINDADQIVGSATIPGEQNIAHAFLWNNGVITDLGTLPSAGQTEGEFGPELVNTFANAINNAGQIVGTSYPGFGPFIWEAGDMTDLNDLIDPASGWTITEAADINDHGQIAGSAVSSTGLRRAVLLTPVTCAADFDADGQPTIGDIFAFLAGWFAGNPGTDLDTVPGQNVGDIFAFMAIWFQGCP